MRILLVNKYHQITGGADTYFFSLRKLLKGYGHEVAEFCLDHPNNEYSDFSQYFIQGVTNESWKDVSSIVSLKTFFYSIYNFEAKKKFKSLVTDFKPDIVHIQNMFYQISPSILSITKKLNIPVVETLHDYHLVCANNNLFHHGKICEDCIQRSLFSVLKNKCYNNSFKASFLAFIANIVHRLLRLYKNRISLWISPSYFLKSKMIEGKISANKIVVNPNPIEINKKLLHYFVEGKYVLYLGRLVEHKGIKTFLQAAQRLKQLNFYIAGHGNLENYTKTFIEDNSLTNVRFLGRVKNSEVPKLIINSKFVVIPSEWYDNLPLVVLETLSYGKPLIGSNIGGIPEMITEDVGFTFEPGNVSQLIELIKKLYYDRNLRNKMGKCSREKIINKFNSEIHYNALMETYKNVLK